MYKLIVADLDGTIVYNQKVSTKVKNTVKELKEKGYTFAIATGRHFSASLKIYNELELSGPMVCSNGAMVYDPKKDEILSVQTLSSDSAFYIARECLRHNSDFIVYTSEMVYATKEAKNKLLEIIGDDPLFNIVVKEPKEIIEKIDDNVLKILALEYDDEKYDVLFESISKREEIKITTSHKGFIDCSKKFVNKAYGVAKLAEYYEISMSDIIAFGDQDNDVEMLQSVGFGVAMNNASSKAKVAADFITGDVREDGFSFGIEMFVL